MSALILWAPYVDAKTKNTNVVFLVVYSARFAIWFIEAALIVLHIY